jgi:hypothetical protein
MATGQKFTSGAVSGQNFASGAASGQNFASGMASGQNFASGAASGHKRTSGAASGHNMASGPAFGHKVASDAASGHHMASGPAFGLNFASGAASGHNMASGLASGHNMASGVASGQNLAFGRNKLFELITAFGHVKLIDHVGHNHNSQIQPQLIVAIPKDFKRYLFFQDDCRIFCEGDIINLDGFDSLLGWEICPEFRGTPRLFRFRTFWTPEFSSEFYFSDCKMCSRQF